MSFEGNIMDVAIEVENLGKRYYINSGKSMKEKISNFISYSKSVVSPLNKKDTTLLKKEFWALNNLNFSIQKGESVGIIGPNGAGKSTLLKILSKVTKPTKGFVKIKGKVGALIEVGAGFHPDFTGKENIYLNASILGMRKNEINAKLDEIIAFAGLEEFINTPVKRYSSGMYVRLGFAIAVNINPDILLVDEILSVGDFVFRKKCFENIRYFREKGNTLFLVSHNLLDIENNCKRVIYINHGIVKYDGNTSEGIAMYLNDATNDIKIPDGISPLSRYLTSGDIELNDIQIMNQNDEKTDEITQGSDLKIILEYSTKRPILLPKIEIGIASDGVTIGQTNTHSDGGPDVIGGKGQVRCTIPNISLIQGVYHINVYFSDGHQGGADLLEISNAKMFKVINPASIRLGCGIPGFMRFFGKWESIS